MGPKEQYSSNVMPWNFRDECDELLSNKIHILMCGDYSTTHKKNASCTIHERSVNTNKNWSLCHMRTPMLSCRASMKYHAGNNLAYLALRHDHRVISPLTPNLFLHIFVFWASMDHHMICAPPEKIPFFIFAFFYAYIGPAPSLK